MLHPPIQPSFEAIADQFGTSWMSSGLFYADTRALRFELGVGDDATTYLLTATKRLTAIATHSLHGCTDVLLVTQHFCDEKKPPPADRAYVIESLVSLGLPNPHPSVCTHTLGSSDGQWFIALLRVSPSQALDVAASAIRTHKLSVRFVSPEKGIIIYPYDDRGMDVTGTNPALLRELHARFSPWLLDYDREEMARRYPPLP